MLANSMCATVGRGADVRGAFWCHGTEQVSTVVHTIPAEASAVLFKASGRIRKTSVLSHSAHFISQSVFYSSVDVTFRPNKLLWSIQHNYFT